MKMYVVDNFHFCSGELLSKNRLANLIHFFKYDFPIFKRKEKIPLDDKTSPHKTDFYTRLSYINRFHVDFIF